MTIQEAVSLIRNSKIEKNNSQLWADLGCGSGIFSKALASLLPPGSHILCIDQRTQALTGSGVENVSLEFLKGDFTKIDFKGKNFDGFLMANSLHFVKNKTKLLRTLIGYLKENGRLIIVEYEINKSSPWIPYPVAFAGLESLLPATGISIDPITKIGERPSIYGSKMMYACQIDCGP